MSRAGFYLFLSLAWTVFCGICSARPAMVLFGSDGCDECQEIKDFWKEYGKTAGSPCLIYVNIDKAENYQFLKEVEAQAEQQAPGNSFPVVLFGKKFLNGSEAFFEQFQEADGVLPPLPELPVMKSFLEKAENSAESVLSCDWETQARQEEVLSAQVIPLLYFFQKGCQNCSRQLRELDLLADRLPGLQTDRYDIGTEEGQLMLQRAKIHFKMPDDGENVTPMVAWQNGYIARRLARAEELLDQLQPATGKEFWKGDFSQKERAELARSQGSLLQQATVTVIAFAGLLDGINPCAFATSIFLISYLLYLKRSRRQIILVGVCFCAGVFCSYLLFGLGFSFLIDFLSNIHWFKSAMYSLFGAVALVLGVLHLRDALKYRASGKSSDMDMGLSQNTHRRIHEQIKKLTSVHSWMLVPAALVLGAVVSSMELACTGQIYLPTIAAINSTGIHLRAFCLLLLYNACFILPLLVVTGLAAAGIGGKALANWAKSHVFSTKVWMAVLFFCIAALMLALAW